MGEAILILITSWVLFSAAVYIKSTHPNPKGLEQLNLILPVIGFIIIMFFSFAVFYPIAFVIELYGFELSSTEKIIKGIISISLLIVAVNLFKRMIGR